MGERRMYSAMQRLNTLSTISISNLAFFTALLALSTLYFAHFVDCTPVVDVRLHAVHRFGRLGIQRYYGNEEAHVTLDLDADLRPLLHWNVKQLFVFIVARWQTKAHKNSEVVLWDFIVESEDQAQIRFQDLTSKYPLVDKGRNLRDANVTVEFHWNVMSYSGLLLFSQKRSQSVTFPSKYVDDDPVVF
eukprot:GGOE01061323.1.p2 GENE.GGOE01061323.1~~GGOE01061323.1.p2  ORF type:complete len:204 (+),score=79.08 GGOE01061323.1:46-612(+)